MRILFIGSVLFSKKALEKLISMDADIVGVVCKQSSKFNTDFYDLGLIAQKNNIPFYYTKKINAEETENWIREKSPDVIYCFGWSQIIKSNILNIPTMGIVGFHPAKVPYNKGRHPIIWALFLGLNETASTFFFMDEGTDTGDILTQKNVDISFNDDAASLYEKITNTALEQIEEFTNNLKHDTYSREPQSNSVGNSWRKRGIDDGKIDWRMNSIAIYNLVRALTKPYVGAHIVLDHSEFKIWKVKIIEKDNYTTNLEPGKILSKNYDKNTFRVKTYDGIIEILDHNITDLQVIGEYI